MKKKKRTLMYVGLFILVLAVLGYVASFAVKQETIPSEKWCFPIYGSAKCVVDPVYYYVVPSDFNLDGKLSLSSSNAYGIDVTSQAGSSLQGRVFTCDERMESCKIGVLGDTFVGTNKRALVYQITKKSGEKINGVIDFSNKDVSGKYIIREDEMPILSSGDKIELSSYLMNFFYSTPLDFNDIKFDSQGVIIHVRMSYLTRYLDIISTSTGRESVIGYGCNFIKSAYSGTSDVIKTDTDTTKLNKDCTFASCLNNGIINWVEDYRCGDALFVSQLSYNGKQYVCRQGSQGQLWTIGKLTTSNYEYNYPQTYSGTNVACCPGYSIGNKQCVQEGDNIYLKELTSGEKECISDNQCFGQGVDLVYTSTPNLAQKWGCEGNKCIVTESITVSCSPNLPCIAGQCNYKTGKCEIVEEGEVVSDGEKKTGFNWDYILWGIVVLLIIIFILSFALKKKPKRR